MVTWILIGAVLVISLLLTRKLRVNDPGKGQLALEGAVKWLYNFFDETMGGRGKEYYFYLMAVMVYIGMANLIGIIGFKPPTKDINVTIALALMSIILVQVAGWRQGGGREYLKGYGRPLPIMVPLNILELAIKPTSLCMRLFGNVLGSFVIMELIKLVLPVIVPVILSLYFDVFDGLIQAYVFVFLTALYMCESMENSEEPAEA